MTARLLRHVAPLALLGLAACGSQPPPPAVSTAVVTVSQPIERAVTDYAGFTGRTAAVESVEVRARVSGYLHEIAFQPGQDVKTGQLLFQIEPRIYEAALEKAQADVKQFQAQAALAQTEHRRAIKLTSSQAISAEEFDKIVAQRDQALANVAAAKATVKSAEQDLAWTKVMAPVNGKTSVNLLTKGNLVVKDQTLLTTIVSQDPIYVYFDVDESTMLHIQQLIRAGKATSYRDAQVPVELGLSSEKGYPHRGIIDYVSNQVNTGTGTLNVRGNVPNHERILTAGLFCRVRIPVGRAHQATLVTDRALASDQGQSFVLAVNDKNEVVRRDVEIAARHAGGLREITAGIGPHDWVIVDGLLRVRPGVSVEPRRVPMPVHTAAVPAASTPAASAKKP